MIECWVDYVQSRVGTVRKEKILAEEEIVPFRTYFFHLALESRTRQLEFENFSMVILAVQRVKMLLFKIENSSVGMIT